MGKEDMLLYWGSGSPPCIRTMIALEEKGFSGYPQKLIEFGKKEHKTEEVLALNPRGQVPAFKDGDVIINESYAIIHYLQHRYPDSGTNLLPGDCKQQGFVLQRYYEVQAAFYPKVLDLFKTVMNKEATDEAKAKKGEELVEEATRFDAYLKDGTFLAGDQFSMADIDFITILLLLDRQEFKLEGRFPNMFAYWQRLKDRPSVVASYPPHFKTSESTRYFASC
ncbi:glutathione S-transferase A-like [Sycon ciliatum]|uniref:glutathione S-transferase A-like n=1 Tax=Sycon ciliatum TaxID=27933 RepID=UPI0031F62E23